MGAGESSVTETVQKTVLIRLCETQKRTLDPCRPFSLQKIKADWVMVLCGIRSPDRSESKALQPMRGQQRHYCALVRSNKRGPD